MESDECYMQLAIEESLKGIGEGNRPFASILIDRNGNVVAKAHNTVLKDNDPLAHGETNVIRTFCKKIGTIDLKGYTIFATSEPCPMCAAAIGWANISRLVFGGFREDFKSPGYKRQNTRVADYYKEQGVGIEVTGGVLRDKVIKMYEKFKTKS